MKRQRNAKLNQVANKKEKEDQNEIVRNETYDSVFVVQRSTRGEFHVLGKGDTFRKHVDLDDKQMFQLVLESIYLMKLSSRNENTESQLKKKLLAYKESILFFVPPSSKRFLIVIFFKQEIPHLEGEEEIRLRTEEERLHDMDNRISEGTRIPKEAIGIPDTTGIQVDYQKARFFEKDRQICLREEEMQICHLEEEMRIPHREEEMRIRHREEEKHLVEMVTPIREDETRIHKKLEHLREEESNMSEETICISEEDQETSNAEKETRTRMKEERIQEVHRRISERTRRPEEAIYIPERAVFQANDRRISNAEKDRQMRLLEQEMRIRHREEKKRLGELEARIRKNLERLREKEGSIREDDTRKRKKLKRLREKEVRIREEGTCIPAGTGNLIGKKEIRTGKEYSRIAEKTRIPEMRTHPDEKFMMEETLEKKKETIRKPVRDANQLGIALLGTALTPLNASSAIHPADSNQQESEARLSIGNFQPGAEDCKTH
ncbi:unnamed protein product [Orchesella dallaii]